MSDAPPRPRGGATRTLVAVLERRGRFLTAEPLFPAREGEGATRRERLTVRLAQGRGAGANARAGDLVLVGLPERRGGPGARVQRVIGRPDRARDMLEALMLDRGLRRRFPREVEEQAREAGARVAAQGSGRRDLRDLATFTIDPASARDFDDAISAEPLRDGRTRVWVHIADVAAHVPEGSALDREARRRATSVYVPGAVEPMLPHALSSDACSLMAGVDRPAVTVELDLEGARVLRSAFYRSLIRSDARLDYDQVDRIFAGGESAREPWSGPLASVRAVAAALAERRRRAGALVVDSEEPEFEFDEDGAVAAIRARPQTESHRLIEHLMILANEAVAELLHKRELPCLYRVHERPQPERVERLIDQLATLEVPTPPLPERLSSTQAAALVGEISRRVDEHVRRTGHGRIALTSLVLRSLKQAYYSPENLGHAGLHSACYCHFTSPIRRYPDLVCHRALLAAVGGGEAPPRAQDLGELGAWTSEREREAMTIERDADDLARCFALRATLFEGDPERAFAGEVTGLIGAGAFIAFGAVGARAAAGDSDRPYEGMLPVRQLSMPVARAEEQSGTGRGAAGRRGGAQPRRSGRADARPPAAGGREWWELNEQGTILRGERSGATLRLGDEIAVRVARVDTVRGRVDLLPGD